MLKIDKEKEDLNSAAISIVQRGRSSGKYLLFIRCASELPLCLLDYVQHDDLVVVLSMYRKPDFPIADNFWVVEGGGSKFHAAKLFLKAEPSLKSFEYSAYFDNDIAISFSDLMGLFDFGARAGADLYQGAVAFDSNTAWGFLKQKTPPSAWRETSFVEVMAPFFSRRALALCLETFDMSISTWGLDYVWYDRCRGFKLGVTDTFVMRHDSVVDSRDGPFYRYLKSVGVDAHEEFRRLKQTSVGRFYKACEVPKIVPTSLKRLYVGSYGFADKLRLKVGFVFNKTSS